MTAACIMEADVSPSCLSNSVNISMGRNVVKLYPPVSENVRASYATPLPDQQSLLRKKQEMGTKTSRTFQHISHMLHV